MKRLASIFFLGLCLATAGAQALDISVRQRLIQAARTQYETSHMQGASLFNIDGNTILVTIVGAKKSPNVQRVAQVKAARTAGEFLKSAQTSGVTVYKTSESNAYAMLDNAVGIDETNNALADTQTRQQTSEDSFTATVESFSDKIIQTSLTRVNHMESLAYFGIDDGEAIYAFFLLIE